jgi:catechol 2,3-dioxygenase-like lactoylglutathione lyase family enzyme
MKDYIIGGIQQVGIGVTDLKEAWQWYIKAFGVDCRIFEDYSEANLMLPYTGGQPHIRHAVLAMNLQGGGGFEIWQYKVRQPVPQYEEIRLGDLGIIACKVKVKDIDKAYEYYRLQDYNLLGEPQNDPSGEKTFFLKDPYGNIFQICKSDNWLFEENKISGGSCGVIIGVSDVEKSKILYSDILGYREALYDSTGTFPDLSTLPGGSGNFRRILLRNPDPLRGHFSPLFGTSLLELICPVEAPGAKTYKDRYWGDPGFIHLCFDIRGIDQLKAYCKKLGFPFTVDSRPSHGGKSFDMGEAAGHFAYIEDPDSTLIEFVETHKIPIIKKIGWYLNLSNRTAYRPLPLWLLKTLRFSRIKNPLK